MAVASRASDNSVKFLQSSGLSLLQCTQSGDRPIQNSGLNGLRRMKHTRHGFRVPDQVYSISMELVTPPKSRNSSTGVLESIEKDNKMKFSHISVSKKTMIDTIQ